MKKRIPSLVLLCCIIIISAQKHHLKKHFSQDFYKDVFVGFSLYDAENQKYIYEYNAEKYFTPASNTKIFTLYYVLEQKQDSVPTLHYKIQNDTLYFSGVGDATLLHQKFNNRKAIDFLAAQKIPLVLYYKNVEETFGEGWTMDDYYQGYQPEKNGFPLYGNVVKQKNGSTIPEYFKNKVSIAEDEFRIFNENTFQMKENSELAFITSDTLTQKLLENLLRKKIIITRKNPFAEGKNQTLYSLKTEEVLKEMMKKSNNFLAEQLFLIKCYKTQNYTCNTQQQRDSVLQTIYGTQEKPKWRDGSGLSRYNLFSPNQMIILLQTMYKKYDFEMLKDYFAINGQYGTLEKFLPNEKPFIYAKTGGVSNNYNISGFLVTDKGKVFIFSYMNNHYLKDISEIKTKMAEILLYIKQEY